MEVLARNASAQPDTCGTSGRANYFRAAVESANAAACEHTPWQPSRKQPNSPIRTQLQQSTDVGFCAEIAPLSPDVLPVHTRVYVFPPRRTIVVCEYRTTEIRCTPDPAPEQKRTGALAEITACGGVRPSDFPPGRSPPKFWAPGGLLGSA